jgi:hypothetical protein
MKRKLLPFLMMVVITIMGSCVGDDIDDLQGQIDDLNGKVTELEKSQQEALLAEIAKLQATIAALEGDMDSQYEALLNNLTLLEDEVANNKDAVFYGNLLTDEDFAAVVAQGATIVTGKAVATTQAHIDALAAIKMIGGELIINGGTTINLPALENIGGDLMIKGLAEPDVTVELPALVSVGEEFGVMENSALVSVKADALVLISDYLYTENNENLTTLSLAVLDLVGSIEMSNTEALAILDLSTVNVLKNVDIRYIGGDTLRLGNVEGDFYLANTTIKYIDILAEEIGGDLTISNNTSFETLNFKELVTVGGNLSFKSNKSGGYGGWSAAVVNNTYTFPAFEALVSIGGNVEVTGNDRTSIEAFNSVTIFGGSMIEFSSNGFELSLLSVFNAIEVAEGAYASKWFDIKIHEKVEWLNSFTKLKNVGDLRINVDRTEDENWQKGDVLKVDGFDALTQVGTMYLRIPDVTEFTAFPALTAFKGYGTVLEMEMPKDNTVGLCSMSALLNQIADGTITKTCEFKPTWNTTMDKVEAVTQLLAPCSE